MEDQTVAERIRALWTQKEEKLPQNQYSRLTQKGYSLPSLGRKLTGPKNFNFWKFRIKYVLEPEGLTDLLSLETPRPMPDAYNKYARPGGFNFVAVWECTSKLVARWLVSNVSTEIFNKLEEGKSYVYADETWALIEQTIEGQDPQALNSYIMNTDNSQRTEMRSASIRPIANPVVGELQPVGEVDQSIVPPFVKVMVTNSHENIQDTFCYTVQDVKMKDAMFQVVLAIDFWGLKVGSILADEHSIQVRLAHDFKDKELWFLACRDMVTQHGLDDVDDMDENEDAPGAKEVERIEDVKEVEKTENMEESL